MSIASLERALAAIGLPGTIDVRGSLAILRVEGEFPLADALIREAAVGLAATHGFSHLALELFDDVTHGASLHRA